MSLPSMARSMRNHVDAGKRRSAFAGHVDEIDHHQRADAGLHDQVERLDGAIDHALHERARAVHRAHARQPRRIDRDRGFRDGLPAHPQQSRQLNAARVRRGRIETVKCIDQAPRIRRVAWQRRAPPKRDWCARTKLVPSLPTPGLAASVARPDSAGSEGVQSRDIKAATASSPSRSGKVEVRVRSSFRSRRRASTAARAAIFTSISLNFRHYSD